MEVLAMTPDGIVVTDGDSIVVIPTTELKSDQGHTLIEHGALSLLKFVSGFLVGVSAANE